MERNVLVDRLKGYACFLVLFGHVIMGIRKAGIEMPGVFYGAETFIWSFHVSLFLFLSGVVYKITGEWKGKKTKGGFIKHKLINLGVPYIIFSTIYIFINSFVGQANTKSSFSDVLAIWKTPVAQYWYLYALFFLFLVWTVLSDTLKNWQITIVIVAFGYLAPMFDVNLGCFEVVFFSALAFGLGTFIKISYVEKLPILFKVLICVLHIIAGAVLISLDLIETAVIKELIMVAGICSSIAFISIVTKIGIVAKFLDFINKYSFQIYLLHTIFTAGIRIVLMRLNINQWFIHLVVGCICGLVCSVIAAIIAEKVKVFNICFFPSKTLKKIKKLKEPQQC